MKNNPVPEKENKGFKTPFKSSGISVKSPIVSMKYFPFK
jgi:hypothetical protein